MKVRIIEALQQCELDKAEVQRRYDTAAAEIDRLRVELIGLMRAHDQLGDMFAGVSAERDRLREALEKIAVRTAGETRFIAKAALAAEPREGK